MYAFGFYAFWAAAPKGAMTYAFTHRGNFSFSSFFSSFYVPPPQILKSGPGTLDQGQGPSIRARDPQTGPRSLNQGQGPSNRAKEPQSGSGTLIQGQRPSIRARDPQSGPATINQGQGPSIRVKEPQLEPRSPN